VGGPRRGTPQATVRSILDADSNGCGFWGDGETLSITDIGKPTLILNYCSAYGMSKATIVTDARAENYVLLTTKEGHGTNAWTNYLTIYRLTNKLARRKRLKISEGAGPTSRWFYDYEVTTPPQGGLKLILTLRVEGPPEPGLTPSEQTKTVVFSP
jgi:hypothetical protein